MPYANLGFGDPFDPLSSDWVGLDPSSTYVPATYPSTPPFSPGGVIPAASSSTNPLNTLLNSLASQAGSIAQTLAVKPGMYVQTAGGVIANSVPGALPSASPLGASFSSSGSLAGFLPIALLAGGALILLKVMGGK